MTISKKIFKYLHKSYWAATLSEFFVLFLLIGNPVWHFCEVKEMSSNKAIIKSYAVGFLIKRIVFLSILIKARKSPYILNWRVLLQLWTKIGANIISIKKSLKGLNCLPKYLTMTWISWIIVNEGVDL